MTRRKATIFRKLRNAVWTYWMVAKGLNFMLDEAMAMALVSDGRAKFATVS